MRRADESGPGPWPAGASRRRTPRRSPGRGRRATRPRSNPFSRRSARRKTSRSSSPGRPAVPSRASGRGQRRRSCAFPGRGSTRTLTCPPQTSSSSARSLPPRGAIEDQGLAGPQGPGRGSPSGRLERTAADRAVNELPRRKERGGPGLLRYGARGLQDLRERNLLPFRQPVGKSNVKALHAPRPPRSCPYC